MPRPTRIYIRTSLLYLIVGLLLGLLQALPGGRLPTALGGLTVVYYHLLMVGWLTQLIFGVAYWMFPVTPSHQPRGSQILVWMTYFLLNAGLILRAVAEPMLAARPAPIWGPALAVSAGLQWLAAMSFIVNIWPRVRGR